MGKAKGIGIGAGLLGLFTLYLFIPPIKAICDEGVSFMWSISGAGGPFETAVFNGLLLIIIVVGIGCSIKMMFARRE